MSVAPEYKLHVEYRAERLAIGGPDHRGIFALLAGGPCDSV